MAKSKSTRTRGRKPTDPHPDTLRLVKHAADKAAQFAYETAFDLIFKAALRDRPESTVHEVVNSFLSSMRHELEWRARSWKAKTDARTRAAIRS